MSQYGVMPEYGVKQYGASEDYGVRPDYGVGQGDSGPVPSALTSTLTSSAASFTAGGAGVTLTFTALDINSNPVEGYTPVPESGVV